MSGEVALTYFSGYSFIDAILVTFTFIITFSFIIRSIFRSSVVLSENFSIQPAASPFLKIILSIGSSGPVILIEISSGTT